MFGSIKKTTKRLSGAPSGIDKMKRELKEIISRKGELATMEPTEIYETVVRLQEIARERMVKGW